MPTQIKESEIKERKFLTTKKYDVSQYDTPVLSWDYYDAFTNSTQSALAREDNDISIPGENLDKYLKMSMKEMKEELRRVADPILSKAPRYLQDLVQLQEGSGKWTDLAEVQQALNIPTHIRLSGGDPWEQASAFALAAIRQHIELYPELTMVHELGIRYFRSAELLVQAREVIAKSRNVLLQDESYLSPKKNKLTSENEPAMTQLAASTMTATASSGQFGLKDKEWDVTLGQTFSIPNMNFTKAIEAKPKLSLFNPATELTNNNSNNNSNSNSNNASFQQSGQVLSLSRSGSRGTSRGASRKERRALTGFVEENIISDLGRIQRSWLPDLRLNSRGSVYDKVFDPSGMPLTVYSPINSKPNTAFFDSTSDGSFMTEFAPHSTGTAEIVTFDDAYNSVYDSQSDNEADINTNTLAIESVSNVDVASTTSLETDLKSPSSRGGNRKKVSTRGSGANTPKTSSRGGLTSPQSSRDKGATPNTPKSRTPSRSSRKQSIQGDSGQDVNQSIASLDQTNTVNSNDLESTSLESPTRTSAGPMSPLNQVLQDVIKPKIDLQAQMEAEAQLNKIQLDIIDMFVALEHDVEGIMALLDKLTKEFNNSMTTADRNRVFDELTCKLGDGSEPKEGFHDWRARRIIGFRPKIVDFLNKVQEMAELRLRLFEINTPWGRSVTDPGANEESNSRWCLMWAGRDIVQSVLHILDSLRERRELSDWYGRKFPFLGNPLMLSFNYHEALDILNMRDHISDQMRTKPHLHFGFERNRSNWKFEKFLVSWKDKFEEHSEANMSFNWPEIPNLTEDIDVFRLYTAMLVIYIRCSDSVQRTFNYEKKFISLASTNRGQCLMVGEDGVKPEKILDIQPGLLKFLQEPGYRKKLVETKPPEEAPKPPPKKKKLKPIKLVNVYLLEDVPNVGKKGKVAKVNEDFAKMYLIPRHMAELEKKRNEALAESSKPSSPIRTSRPKSVPADGDFRASTTAGRTLETMSTKSKLKEEDSKSHQNSISNEDSVNSKKSKSPEKKRPLSKKSSRMMSKEALATEVRESRTVTRLPPVGNEEGNPVKLTRRVSGDVMLSKKK